MTQQADCIFCQIVAGKIPALKVFENENSIAFMDIKLPGKSGVDGRISEIFCAARSTPAAEGLRDGFKRL